MDDSDDAPSDDHSIKFWEAWSGICSRTIQSAESVRTQAAHAGRPEELLKRMRQKQVTRIAISPDKKVLAVAGYNHVR